MTPWMRWRAAAIGALLIGIAGAFAAARLRVVSDITHFLPAGGSTPDADLANAIAHAPMADTLVFAVGGPSSGAARAAAMELASRLRSDPEVAWIRAGADADTQRTVYDVFHPARFAFVADEPEALRAAVSPEGLRQAARRTRERISGPEGMLLTRLVPTDPALYFVSQLERVRAASGDVLRDEGGQFMTRDGRWAVLFAGTRHPAFDVSSMAPFLDRARPLPPATLERSGVAPHAVASERVMRRDIQRVSVFSTVGIVALFVLLFGSVRHLLLASVPLVAGTAGGMFACLALHGSVHGLTLAFGSALLGVCIDYPLILLTHHAGAEVPATSTLERVLPGMRLGAWTTVAGLAGMAATRFPGIREIATFAGAGVFSALAATRWMIPAFTPAGDHHRVWRRTVALAEAAVAALPRHRRVLLGLYAVALVLSVLGVSRLQWNDDLRSLGEVDPRIGEEDLRVQARITPPGASSFVFATGPDEPHVLATNDRVARALDRAVHDGLLDSYASLHALLWSPEAQRASLTATRGDPSFLPRLGEAFASEGFSPRLTQGMPDAMASARTTPLTLADLDHAGLGPMTLPFRVEVSGRPALVSVARGVRDPQRFRALLPSGPEVRWFDQDSFLRDAFTQYRRQTVRLVVVGLFLVLAMMFVRYRRPARAFAAFVPCVLAAGATLGVLALAGVSLGLVHVMALLLVLSMGSDYGIFCMEAALGRTDPTRTILSMALSCAMTGLSFGLLGMSHAPALRGLGTTTAVGMTLTLLLAPLALAWFEPEGTARP